MELLQEVLRRRIQRIRLVGRRGLRDHLGRYTAERRYRIALADDLRSAHKHRLRLRLGQGGEHDLFQDRRGVLIDPVFTPSEIFPENGPETDPEKSWKNLHEKVIFRRFYLT